MPGLAPGIYVFATLGEKDVDGRDEPGHDGGESGYSALLTSLMRGSAASLRLR
jgi:hypothetical protein